MQNMKSALRVLKGNKNVKMIEGDDKARAQKCLAELKEASKSFKCSLVPEIILSGGKVMDRLKIKGDDEIGKQAFKIAIDKIFSAYDCIAFAELKFADNKITDSIKILAKPRGEKVVPPGGANASLL